MINDTYYDFIVDNIKYHSALDVSNVHPQDVTISSFLSVLDFQEKENYYEDNNILTDCFDSTANPYDVYIYRFDIFESFAANKSVHKNSIKTCPFLILQNCIYCNDSFGDHQTDKDYISVIDNVNYLFKENEKLYNEDEYNQYVFILLACNSLLKHDKLTDKIYENFLDKVGYKKFKFYVDMHENNFRDYHMKYSFPLMSPEVYFESFKDRTSKFIKNYQSLFDLIKPHIINKCID